MIPSSYLVNLIIFWWPCIEMYLLSHQRQALKFRERSRLSANSLKASDSWRKKNLIIIHTVLFWNNSQITSSFISWFLDIPTKIINFTHPLFITSNFSQIQAIYSVRYQKGTLNLDSNLPNSDRKQWSDPFELILSHIWRWVFIKTEDKFQVLWW